jgi:hypothetical protein
MNRLFRYFAPGTRGTNVYLMSDGTYLQDPTAPLPTGSVGVSSGIPAYWNPSEPSEPFVRTVNVDGTTSVVNYTPSVVKVYWGGCANHITPAEATALTAAGYGPYLS